MTPQPKLTWHKAFAGLEAETTDLVLRVGAYALTVYLKGSSLDPARCLVREERLYELIGDALVPHTMQQNLAAQVHCEELALAWMKENFGKLLV